MSVLEQAILDMCLEHETDGVSTFHREEPPMRLTDLLGHGEGKEDEGRIV